MSHPFFDAIAFPFDHPLANDFHNALYRAISSPNSIELRCRKCSGGILLNKSATPDEIWMEALEKLTSAAKLKQLCEMLLADRSVAAIHPIVRAVINADSADAPNRELGEQDLKVGAIEKDSVVVLVVTANPSGTSALDLEKEAELIQKAIVSARPGRDVLVHPQHAASINALRNCLHRFSPRIVHFAGHGNDDGIMLFEADDGSQQKVSPTSLANLIREFSCVETVVLNACYSAAAAEALSEFVDCVVGMGNKIDNQAASEFALAFYEGLAFGKDYATAFRMGCTAIKLNEMPDADQPMAFLPGIKTTDANALSETSSISARKQRSATPNVSSLESVSDEKVVSVKLWYGTNRKPKDTAHLELGYSNHRDDKINYGTCEVAVPRRRDVGSIGSWAWYRWLTWNDDRVKLDWNSIEQHESKDFWHSLQQTVANLDHGKKHALVFIHGFNVSFKDAARRTAQIAVDLPFPGPAAFFSWPSLGHMLGYSADGETIRYTELYLIEFLTNFVQQSGADRIHLIAHSMGNRGLLEAMIKVIDVLSCTKPFDQIILAAPDVDLGVFGQRAAIYDRAAKQTTLYASRRDRAVWASKLVNLQSRVGYYARGENPRIFDAIDTVHIMSSFDLFDLGHGYVASEDLVLADMHQAITFGASPALRRRLAERKFVEKSYWELNVE